MRMYPINKIVWLVAFTWLVIGTLTIPAFAQVTLIHDGFETYSTGLLPGQGDWSGGAWTVQSGAVYEGIKAAYYSGTSSTSHAITQNKNVSVVYYIRSGDVSWPTTLKLYEGATLIAFAGWDNGQFWDSAGYFGAPLNNVWYRIELRVDSNNTHQIIINNGTTAYLIGRANSNPMTNGIDTITLSSITGSGYFDNIHAEVISKNINWHNNYTNDNTQNFSVPAISTINFSITNTTYYIINGASAWFLNGINQTAWAGSQHFNQTLASTGIYNITVIVSNNSGYGQVVNTWLVTRTLTLISPVNGSTIYDDYPPISSDVTFQWDTTGLDYFNIQIAKDTNFGLITYDDYVSGTQIIRTLSGAPGLGTKYYWRLREYNTTTYIYGTWSTVSTFSLIGNISSSGLTGIHGVVYYISDGVQIPISGAPVYISNSTSTWSSTQITGSNGYYLFDNLTNYTTYYLNAKAEGFNDGVIEYVTTTYQNWTTKDLLLTKCISGQNCFGTQNYVKFVATDFWGNLYPNVAISVYKGSDVTTTYTGTTGTDGTKTFLLTKNQEYRLVFSGSIITTTSITITPGESNLFYVFVSAAPPPNWWDNTTYQEVDTVRTSVTTNISYGFAWVNVTYGDSLAQTTGWGIYLNQTNHTMPNGSQIMIQNVFGTGNASVSFALASGYAGGSYLVNINSTHSTFGVIRRSYGVQFYGTKDGSLDFIPPAILALIAILIIVFVGSFFDSTNFAQGAGLVCVIGWIELGLGMFAFANMSVSVGIGLGIASVIAIVANMNERNKREVAG